MRGMTESTQGSASKRHGIAYRPEIDGLRAVAVLAVMLNHAGVPGFPGGFVGVDIFFVISGFLITAIINKDLLNGSFNIADFYERRARRIMPALIVVLVATIIAGAIIQSPKQFKELGQALVAIATFTSNFYFPLKISYFAEDAHYNPLIHAWSLSVEEQFYLLFPLLVWWLTGRFRPLLLPALGLIALASLGWAIHSVALDPVSTFFSTLARAWELLAGAMLSFAYPQCAQFVSRNPRTARWIELAGTALVVGSILLVSRELAWPGLATIPVVIGTAMIIATASATTPLGRLLAAGPVLLVGQISYSAYLWHQPIFAMTRIAFGAALSGAVITTCIVATLVVAWLSWKFVETPFRGRHRSRRLVVFGTTLTVSAVVVATGFFLYRAQGLPQRFDAETRAIAATMAVSPLRDKCHTDEISTLWPEAACRYFGGKTTWAVFSDSHGVEPAYALAEMLKPRDEGVLHLTFSGCPAALTYEHPAPNCRAWTRRSLAYLKQKPEIRNVMVIYRWSFDLYGDQTLTYPDMPKEAPRFLSNLPADQARERFWESFSTLVAELRRAGKHVTIIRPVPDLPVSVERYIYGKAEGKRPTGMTRALTEIRHGAVNRRLDAFENTPGVSLIDPRRLLCDEKNCWSVRDATAFYFDDNHLSVIGARQLLAMAMREGSLKLAPSAPSSPKDGK